MSDLPDYWGATRQPRVALPPRVLTHQLTAAETLTVGAGTLAVVLVIPTGSQAAGNILQVKLSGVTTGFDYCAAVGAQQVTGATRLTIPVDPELETDFTLTATFLSVAGSVTIYPATSFTPDIVEVVDSTAIQVDGSGHLQPVNVTNWAGNALAIGQGPAATSIPVAPASDLQPLPWQAPTSPPLEISIAPTVAPGVQVLAGSGTKVVYLFEMQVAFSSAAVIPASAFFAVTDGSGGALRFSSFIANNAQVFTWRPAGAGVAAAGNGLYVYTGAAYGGGMTVNLSYSQA